MNQIVGRRGVKVDGKCFWNDDFVHRYLGSKVDVVTSKAKVLVRSLTGELIATFDADKGEQSAVF